MDKAYIASLIDHAVLKPEATDQDLERECAIAAKYKVASVCVKPSHVKLAAKLLEGTGVKVSTVIGFPHGSTTTACKVVEAQEAIDNGAVELDMVINVGMLLSGNLDGVREDIWLVADVCHENDALLKVIIETALLSDESKIVACKLAEEAGADFVKTSTGFNGRGATLEDIKLMKAAVSEKVKIKASGGIKTLAQALAFAEAGCERLGTSSTVQIIEGEAEDKESGY